MSQELPLRIILLKPTADTDFGLQKGTGTNYTTDQKQRSTSQNLAFTCVVTVKGNRNTDLSPKFSGKFVQGPATGKFIYIGIGTHAGQTDSIWSRRLKIPLTGITWSMIDQQGNNPTLTLETQVAGTDSYGTPACATPKPFNGWQVKQV